MWRSADLSEQYLAQNSIEKVKGLQISQGVSDKVGHKDIVHFLNCINSKKWIGAQN